MNTLTSQQFAEIWGLGQIWRRTDHGSASKATPIDGDKPHLLAKKNEPLMLVVVEIHDEIIEFRYFLDSYENTFLPFPDPTCAMAWDGKKLKIGKLLTFELVEAVEHE